MKTYAQALDLKDDPETIALYEKYHREVWPEVVAALREIGVLGMRIYRTGTRLFMIIETTDEFDPKRDFKRQADITPRSAEWDVLMRGYQRKVPSAGPEDWWTPMALVFDMDWSPVSGGAAGGNEAPDSPPL